MGEKLPALNLEVKDISQLETYGSHSCILSRGHVKCWGDNSAGQLGYEDTVKRGRDPKDMAGNLRFVDLGLPVLRLAKGSQSDQTCAVLINHEVKCWGEGVFGSLGYEDTDSRGGTLGDMGENLPYIHYK